MGTDGLVAQGAPQLRGRAKPARASLLAGGAGRKLAAVCTSNPKLFCLKLEGVLSKRKAVLPTAYLRPSQQPLVALSENTGYIVVSGQKLDIHSTGSPDQGTLAVVTHTQGFLFPDVSVERESGLESENHKP